MARPHKEGLCAAIVATSVRSALEPLIQGGGGGCTGTILPPNISWGENSATIGNPKAAGCCTQPVWLHHPCRMAVKECGLSPVVPCAAATPVPCNCAVVWQRVPVTGRLRALAAYCAVCSAVRPQASPLGPEHQAHTTLTTTNCGVSRRTTISPPPPRNPPPCDCPLAQVRTRGAAPDGTLQVDGSPFLGHT